MAIVMLRHGAVPQGTANAPLTRQGQHDAIMAAERLKHLPITDILASPEERSVQTAQIWGKATGVPVKVVPQLDSWNLGVYKGHHSANADAVVRDLVAHPDRKAPGGGESAHDYWARLLPAIAPLIADDQLHGIVNHSRGLKSVESYMAGQGEGMDKATWSTPVRQPGDAIIVDRNGVKDA